MPEGRRAYRYTIEIRALADGSSRLLPPEVISVIALTAKGTATEKPSRQLLRLKDGEEILEAADLDELRIRLRDKYPDSDYERRLHVQRDREAEERREAAIMGLARLLARAAVEEELRKADVGYSSTSSEGASG
jgi:hypothetical protein